MWHTTTSATVLLTLALMAGLSRPCISSWNQFRGPNGSGVAEACKPPVKIDSDHLAWKTPVPPGHSSPVLSSRRIFLTAVEGDRLVTLAFDKASGRLVWRKEAPEAPIEKVHETSSPAASTPHVDKDRVYVYFGSFGLLCYDHDGREQWRKPIPTPKSLYGMSTSPIGYEGSVILVLDNDANLPGGKLSQSKVIAVDKSTGELVWETSRPLNRSGWSTPTIWTNDGDEDLVVLGNGRVYGYDPSTGAEKWSVHGFSRETIAVPVSGGGHVYVSSAKLGGVADAQPDPTPFWNAIIQFDQNGDGKLQRSEMTGTFTFPLRPELPLGHPGFGIPLPKDEARRKKSLDGILRWVDKDKDGCWTREEFVGRMSPGHGRPLLMAIRPGGKGDVTDSHVSWEVNRNIPEVPSPIFYDNRLYMVRNGGIIGAVDATSGKTLYRKRLRATGEYSASPAIADGHLFLISEQGLLSVVKAGDEFQIVHQHDLQQPVFATPAFDESTIYVRTTTQLLAFRTRG